MRLSLTSLCRCSLPVAAMLLAAGTAHGQVRPPLARGPVVLKHADRVLDLAFAPNGAVLATTTRNSNVVTLWNPTSGQVVRTLPLSSKAGALAFSPDGSALAVSEASGAVSAWSTQTWTRVSAALVPATGPGAGIAYGRVPARKPAGPLSTIGSRTVLATWVSGQVRVFDVTSGTGQPLYTLACSNTAPDPMDPYVPRAHTVLFTRNGLRVATVCDHRITLWNAATGVQQEFIPAVLVEDAAFSPDSRLLANVRQAANTSPQVVVRNLAMSAEYTFGPPPPLPSPGFYATAFSPDGAVLAAGQWQTGNVVLWNVATRAVLRTLTGHNKYVTRLAFSPDGALLASGGGPDSTVRLWKLR